MTLDLRKLFVLTLSAILALGAAGGCSSIDPFGYDDPPASSVRLQSQSVEGERTVVVLGLLENPQTASVRWRDIGSGVTESIVRELRNNKRYAVRSDRRLGSDIEQTLVRAAGDRWRRLEKFRNSYPDVDYVVIGEVTDFHHSSDLPKSARQRSIFGEKREAIVAIRLTVVDIASGAVVLDDHVTGTDGVSDDMKSRDQYQNIAFGSYVFWNTPLGEATREAVEKAAERIHKAVPLLQGQPMIVRRIDSRKVELNAGRNMGLIVGQQYFVCALHPTTGEYVALRDVDTNQPLVAKVTDVDSDEATAWLIGRASVDQPIRGTRLLRSRPKDPKPVVAEVDDAASATQGSVSANTAVEVTQAESGGR